MRLAPFGAIGRGSPESGRGHGRPRDGVGPHRVRDGRQRVGSSQTIARFVDVAKKLSVPLQSEKTAIGLPNTDSIHNCPLANSVDLPRLVGRALSDWKATDDDHHLKE